MSARAWMAAACAVIGLGAGCIRGEATMTEEQFCQEYARTECTKVAAFCLFSADSCQPVREAACRDWAGRLKGGGHQYNAQNTDACLKKLSDAYQVIPITAATFKGVDDTCARVFAGTAKALQPCSVDYDCADGLVCDKGACGTAKTVASGAGCANIGERCPQGEYCSDASTGHLLCTKRQALGMPCAATQPCLEDLRCRSTCVQRLPDGMSCATSDDCVNGYCNPYLDPPLCANGLTFAPQSPSCVAYTGAAAADAGGSPTRGPMSSPDAHD